MKCKYEIIILKYMNYYIRLEIEKTNKKNKTL